MIGFDKPQGLNDRKGRVGFFGEVSGEKNSRMRKKSS
jgi:hypothetical protein